MQRNEDNELYLMSLYTSVYLPKFCKNFTVLALIWDAQVTQSLAKSKFAKKLRQ